MINKWYKKNRELTVNVMAIIGVLVTRVSLWLIGWYAAYLVFSWTGVV
jgi:hypothetical protein